MTDGVTASIAVRVTANDVKTPPVGGLSQQVNSNATVSFTPGNGASGLADTMKTVAINIAASGSSTINLSTDLDAFGVALGLTELQAVILFADKANVNNIVMGNAASHPWQGPFDAATDTVATKPGGLTVLADPAGWAVGVGATDQLKLANSGAGTAVTGTLILIGRKA
jgi:hypothetical protein